MRGPFIELLPLLVYVGAGSGALALGWSVVDTLWIFTAVAVTLVAIVTHYFAYGAMIDDDMGQPRSSAEVARDMSYAARAAFSTSGPLVLLLSGAILLWKANIAWGVSLLVGGLVTVLLVVRSNLLLQPTRRKRPAAE
jgi:hypothetical protein